MSLRDGEKIRLFSDELETHSSSKLCRICLEEEDENSASMESPCSCSGTLKFAHRRCIQRWCDEKGSIICEICLQNFEPNYAASRVKPHLIDVVVTLRRNLEGTRHNYESESPTLLFITSSEPGRNYIVQSARSSDCRLSWCRLFVWLLIIILLTRHLSDLLSNNTADYAFSIPTVFLVRAMGILLPLFLVMRIITIIQNAQRLLSTADDDDSLMHEGEDDLEQQLQASR